MKLFQHPDVIVRKDFDLSAGAFREGSKLSLNFEIRGNLKRISLPVRTAKPQRKDDLWKKTCFEAFLTFGDSLAYWELNASPSGDWNFYHLENYRLNLRMEDQVEKITHEVLESKPDLYRVAVQVDLASILPAPHCPIQLGLATVIEEVNGALSYWAIQHCGEEPDFHLRKSFIHSL